MLKVDLQKAYDSVEWCCIKQILIQMRFPALFVNWILKCISTVTYKVNVNGTLTDSFDAQRGLRQGDPISPYLFVLVLEFLNSILGTLGQDLNFNFHPCCEKMGITHFSFADDLLLFSRGDLGSIKLMYEKFQQFSDATGLKENPLKCQVYKGGVQSEDKQQILEFLGYGEGELLVKYLGLPLSVNKLSVMQCKPLIDKITSRINTWMARTLSYAGRAQLIKAVLASMQACWAQVFILPQKVIKLIESICQSYLWSGSATITRRALVAWEKVCLPKSAGGLNLVSLQPR